MRTLRYALAVIPQLWSQLLNAGTFHAVTMYNLLPVVRLANVQPPLPMVNTCLRATV